MEIYFDESGNFRPSPASEVGLCAVMGVIVPENEAASLQEHFSTMIAELPREVFVDGEPKGYRLSAKQGQLLATLVNSHPGVKLVPVTVNTASIDQSFFEKFPPKLKELLIGESEKCLYESMQTEVNELARRCGNLSPDQLVRLLAYTVGVLRAINAVSTFYHCPKYHPYYDPMRMVFDKVGTPNSREELVFKQIVFMWLMRMTERQPITKIKEIHTENHPWMRLYETTTNGLKVLDLVKILRGNLHFADSKRTWQLQLADMLVSAWLNSLRDHDDSLGYSSVFRSLNRNTALPNEQPVGMIGVAESHSQTVAPVQFNVFRQISRGRKTTALRMGREIAAHGYSGGHCHCRAAAYSGTGILAATSRYEPSPVPELGGGGGAAGVAGLYVGAGGLYGALCGLMSFFFGFFFSRPRTSRLPMICSPSY